LRQVCTERGIALIFDEVFVGFRLAAGGAQAYFGVAADMVTYGKTLGGGLPVGVVCGKSAWMKRFRTERPADICFARGTFNSHPYVMGAMQVFLERLQTAPVQALYADLDTLWDRRAAHLNQALRDAGLPVQVAHLSSIWTVGYSVPSRYNWMLQFYLRQQGSGPVVGGHGAAGLQPELHRAGLPGRVRAFCGRRAGHAQRRVVGGAGRRQQQADPAPGAARDAGAALLTRRALCQGAWQWPH
jgi:hypothetical protein